MEMICPGCGSAETRTVTSRPVGALVMRGKRCEACGGEWGTQEGVIQGSFIVRPPVATGSHPRPPEATGGNGIDLRSSLTLIPDPVSKTPEDPEFDGWWARYPKKVGKAAAQRAWRRRKPPIDRCMATLEWQVTSKQWREGFVPNPATWINEGRWEDQPPARKPPPAPYHAPAPEPTYNRPAPWPAKEVK